MKPSLVGVMLAKRSSGGSLSLSTAGPTVPPGTSSAPTSVASTTRAQQA